MRNGLRNRAGFRALRRRSHRGPAPRCYEIYETAKDWLPHLSQLPNIVVRDCDGHTLSQTRDASVDLVHAHKVFVYLEFYATAGYLKEMARVVRPGGTVAFDIVTEGCLDDETVGTWARDGTIYRPVPRVMGDRVPAAAQPQPAWLPHRAAAARDYGIARLPPQLTRLPPRLKPAL